MSATPTPATSRWLHASLWRQLLMPLVGLWVASALVATGAAYWFAGRTTNQSFDRLLADDARALAAQLRWHDGQAQFVASRETADLLVFDSLLRSHYTVRTEDGRTLVGNLVLPLPLPEQAAPPDAPLFFDHPAEGGVMLRTVALRVQPQAGGEAVWVLVAESKTKRQQVTDEIAAAIFLPAGLAGFVIIPLLYYGIRRGLEPARHISALVVQHGENDLSPLSVQEVPEELRELVAHTNALLARLKASVEEQRRFIADAAHQLQTPMAGIRLLVGDMRRIQRADPSQPMDAEVLAQLDEVAARGARMVRQLLAYARAEEESVVEDQLFDAAAVAAQATLRWQGPAAAAGKTLQPPAEAAQTLDRHTVRGSPTLLGEVVSNLIDNALRYGGSHVAVQVQAQTQAHSGRVHILVSDDGPALDAATRAQMLLPFWRGDHGHAEGSGLGLSIAQRVVERMGGRLAVGSGERGAGTRIDIDLPAATQPT
ncbi:MAG: sensor histidine kinase [Proteobacteria bacterium]|nr:sensor histidine kinase [Pseudomonadota bacterium]MBS0495304.1 sensor histidine kinase [Pseudomonadota bacterium]